LRVVVKRQGLVHSQAKLTIAVQATPVAHACRQSNLNGVGAQVAYFTVSPSGEKSQSYPVDVQAPQVMHDFAVTEKYAVFIDHALVFDPQYMIKEKALPFRSTLFAPLTLIRTSCGSSLWLLSGLLTRVQKCGATKWKSCAGWSEVTTADSAS
jgi:carotenoid cleavage dioxygenase-like enzyme